METLLYSLNLFTDFQINHSKLDRDLVENIRQSRRRRSVINKKSIAAVQTTTDREMKEGV